MLQVSFSSLCPVSSARHASHRLGKEACPLHFNRLSSARGFSHDPDVFEFPALFATAIGQGSGLYLVVEYLLVSVRSFYDGVGGCIICAMLAHALALP
jgi:hypothetical protein